MKENSVPLVSIIIPVYNTEKYIRECLDSIISQTYNNFEVIIVDDGSSDQSGVICDEYASKDERFKVIHQNNSGVSMARIAAFENSRGEFITFIDSDDYVSPDYIEKLAKPLIEEDADMACCKYIGVRNHILFNPKIFITGIFQGKTLRDFISNDFFYSRQTNNFGIHPGLATKMVKRDIVMEGLQMGKGLWYGEDAIAVFCMLFSCSKLVALPNNLYYYVAHDNEAVNKYEIDLWWDIIELLQRAESLCCKNNITIDGLRYRIWKYISLTINKMLESDMSYAQFCKDLSVARNHPYLVKFFEPWLIDKEYGAKGNLGFILLKLKKFRLFWLIKKL